MRRYKRKKKDPREIAMAAGLLFAALNDEQTCHELAEEITTWGQRFNSCMLALQGKDPQHQAQQPEGE